MQSHTYQKKIKALTELVKQFYPTKRRISAPLPSIGSEANRISTKLTAKEATARKEAFGKLDAKYLDKATLAYWLKSPDDQPYGRKS